MSTYTYIIEYISKYFLQIMIYAEVITHMYLIIFPTFLEQNITKIDFFQTRKVRGKNMYMQLK